VSVAASALRLLCEGSAVFAAESTKLVIGESQELGGFLLMIARLTECLSQKPDLEGLHSGEKRLVAAGIDHRSLRLQRLRLLSRCCQAGAEGRWKRVKDNIGDQRRIRTVDGTLHDIF